MAADTCEPLYVTARALPFFEAAAPDIVDLCSAAESVTGRGTIRGAQKIRGLWRLYPKQKQYRDKLLLEGIDLCGVHVTLLNKNPYVLTDKAGEETPVTKVWINNIPLACENSVIEETFKKLDVEIRSPIKYELARLKNGQLSSWQTGRRFVLVTIPKQPLASTLKMGGYTAEVYHKEQKTHTKKCNRCLTVGHIASECQGDIVCLVCGEEGHKRGDPLCQLKAPRPLQGPTTGEDDGREAVSTPALPEKQQGEGEETPAATPRPTADNATAGTTAKEGGNRTLEQKNSPTPARAQSKRRRSRSAEEEEKRRENRRSRMEDFFTKTTGKDGKGRERTRSREDT